ncbi:PaaI family thioesterase [Vogesella indigofera]|uniref:PaaI family thioesterase n=1 Tax=Vogesella indigofera TaxID=45465 RepID=UPI00234E7751|nr:PaaI family thioesterase [Vogesella indigofera]MDC7709445.1 PaaI family thioesterase [Vogesella indigofera]
MMHGDTAARMTPLAFQALIDEALPLCALFGIRCEHIGYGRARLRMRFDPAQTRPGGTVAGPAQMAIADATLYAVVLGMIGPVELAVTTSLNINFLRKPPPADIIAEGRILKLGQRLAVGEVLLYSDGAAEPVAHVSGTYSIPPR